jgi:hypothetical protein
MRFEDVLAEFGQATGLGELVLDDAGSCSLLFDGEHELTFTRGREEDGDDAVFLYGVAADAGTLRDAESCRSLLAASCLGAETGGAAFALYGNSLILWKRHEVFADCRALEKTVNGFLGRLIHWKEKLAARPASAAAESLAGGGPQVLGLRV